MAFVDWVANNPGYEGTETSRVVGTENRPADPGIISVGGEMILSGELTVLLSPVYNPNGTLSSGWQVVTEGGGDGGDNGVVPRPEAGMIYPRR